MARIFLLRVGTELDFKSINLQVRELGFASDSEKLYLGTTKGNVNIPTEDIVKDIVDAKLESFDSAYKIWLNNGNTGTEEDFLNSLSGNDGESAYDIWLGLGNTGTEQDFIESLGGGSGSGKQAYTLTTIDLGENGGLVYEIDLDEYDGTEGVYEFLFTEFFSFTVAEGDNSIESAQAPRILPGIFFVPGGIVAPPAGSEDIMAVRTNLNSIDVDDQRYAVYITSDSRVKIRIDAYSGGDTSNVAVLTVTPKMKTSTAIPTVETSWHAT